MEGKLPGIQVGRAVAAASVFYFHSYIALTYFDPAHLETFSYLAQRGASGVDFFFAISGFIVCYVAVRPDFTSSSFLAKRFFRIFPLNAAVTLAIVAITLHGNGIFDHVGLTRLIESILILPQKNPVNSAGWTLEYEVAFYLLAALLIPRGGPRLLLGYCAASYLLWMWFTPASPLIERFITEHHAAFGAGVLGYMIVHRLPPLSARLAWLLAATLPIAGFAIFQWGREIWIPLPTPAGCCLAIIGLTLLPYAPKWIVKFGDISYGFYLLHWPIVCLSNYVAHSIVKPSPEIGEMWRWLVFGCVWLAASLSWIYFERPINEWARSLIRRPRRQSPRRNRLLPDRNGRQDFT